MLVDPETDGPTRIGIRRGENGERIRFSKRSGKDLE
jgi:large subunit ribosomal protein L24